MLKVIKWQNLYISIIMSICCHHVDSSNLLVTNLDLNNHTVSRNETQPISPATTTTPMKVLDSSSRSEIYKMHSNGLVLLHAQRSHSGLGAKKSSLVQSSDASSINYHVRSRTKDNGTSNEVAETERHLETKLGKLPQIHERDGLLKNNHKRAVISSPVKYLSSSENKKTHIMRNKKSERKWRSVIQGESNAGKNILKKHIYPVKLKQQDKRDSELDHLSEDEEQSSTEKQNLHSTIDKHKRLRRAFFIMNDDQQKGLSHLNDNPLFDVEQPEEQRREFKNRLRNKRRRHLKKRLEKLYSRGLGTGITDIPKIPPIENSFDKIEPLKFFPQFPDFRSGIEDYPRFGVPDLKLENYPRFGEPKMDMYESIPGIPHIRPLSRGDEVTGDKRGLPFNNKEEFYDEDLDYSVDHEPSPTPPTPIPYLTDIPSITDIPTIKPIPAAPGKPVGTGGVNGKMPIVQTVDTKNGKETQVSA